MASLTGIIVADFTTSLASEIAVGGTTATLSSATDDDGVALPTGRYFFTIDGANSSKEHISCTLTGTSLTSIKTVSRQGTETSGVLRKHRIGASVSITDFAHILQINNLVKGATDFDATDPLKYDADPTITLDAQFATKKYVDGVAIAGSPDSSTTVKGITKMSTAPASAANPIAVGDNDTRVPTQAENDALVGNNTDVAVGTGNKFVTQTGLQHNAEKYAADAGGTDAYAITLSPAPTSYTAGMVVYFKANTANTGAATLNVNSLGAITIVKGVNTTLITDDILAGQLCTVIYDGTNFVLQSAINQSNILVAANGTTTHDMSTTTTTTIAHGLGKIPKIVKFHVNRGGSSAATLGVAMVNSVGSYDGSTQNCNYVAYSSNGAEAVSTSDASNAIHYGYGATATADSDKLTGSVAFDATNITITWSKTNSPTGTGNIHWEAIA